MSRDVGKSVYTETLSHAQQIEMLRRMIRIRLFDEQASKIKSELIPGFLHNSIGQEGEIVGACMALRSNDYMTGNHRSHGHPIGKGVELAPLMAELLGKRTGVCRGKGGSMHLAVFSVGSLGESGIVGGSMPAAVGAGLSARLRGTDQVSLSFFGDGAANCGPFHESINLAAVWKLPVIFLCENNGYAGCSSQGSTTAAENIADRASAYGIPGVIVDGQDVLAVYEVVSHAVTRARSGAGPTLVEAKTYRYCDHLEAEGGFPVYRDAKELEYWRTRDPIALFSHWLLERHSISEVEKDNLWQSVRDEVSAAVSFAKDSPEPSEEAVFEDVFA